MSYLKQFGVLDDAVRALDVNMVKKILTKNPKLLMKRRVDRERVTLILKKAIILRSTTIIKLFVQYGADLNLGDPLRNVIADGNLELTKLFLENGARPQNVDGLFSSTRVMYTLRNILRVLVQHGLKPDGGMLNAFIRKCNWQEGDMFAPEIAEILIDSGASVNQVDEFGDSALYLALSDSKDISFISLLISRGADVNLGHICEASPLHYALRKDLDVDIHELLISNGADVNSADSHGRTPLHVACCEAGHKKVRLLVLKGAEVNARDVNGRTPLHEACINQRHLCLSFLIQNGADFNAKDDEGNTPFSLINHDEFRDNYLVCFYVILREYAKLVFERARMSRGYTALIKPKMSPELEQSLRDYALELDRLSRVQLWGPYSYYSVLKGSLSLRKLAKLLKDEGLARKIETEMCGFRYFKSDLAAIFDEAILLKNRLVVTECRLTYIFGDKLPEPAIASLAKSLSIYDLPLPGETQIYTKLTLGHFF